MLDSRRGCHPARHPRHATEYSGPHADYRGVLTFLDAYVVAPPGVESLTAAEMAALGLEPGPPEPGGVPFSASPEDLYRAAVSLRTASRILVRAARFRARDFAAVERHARQLPWDTFTRPGDAVRFQVTCKKSRLYHQNAVAQRFADAARAAGRDVIESGDGLAGADAAQRIVVRLFRDRCTVSVDATGEHLHRRGYRQATAKAPLRENLAAAVLLASGWDRRSPLVDPMCGSGTLIIEGALLAQGKAPGRARRFAFERWPTFDRPSWQRALGRAEEAPEEPGPGRLLGSDRDPGAIEAANANARRAGVADQVSFRVHPLSAVEAPPDPGWLVTNPPYGHRIGERGRLRDLYAALGNVARDRFRGWTVVVVATDAVLVGHTRLGLEPCLATRHGGIAIRAWKGRVPA